MMIKMVGSGRQRGFTLVELLVVVAIIGILAAMVFPKINRYLTRAREAKARSNLDALRKAVSIYTAEHDGSYPASLTVDVPASNSYNADIDISSEMINYLGSKIPDNPLKGTNAYYDGIEHEVTNVGPANGDQDGPWDDYYGWLYFAKDGRVRINSNKMSSNGVETYKEW